MKQHLNFCVYKITNSISGKSYIGKAKDLEKRWKGHLSSAKNNKLNSKFPNALRKYSEDTWNISILYETDDEDHCYEVETLLVNEYDTFKFGYNSCGGGKGAGSGENNSNYRNYWSDEQKQNMSFKLTGLMSGDKNPNYRNYWSDEQKQNMKNKMSGENHWFYGGNHTKEHIEYLRQINTGENNPMYGTLPWFNSTTISNKTQLNWYYMDKVYELRIKYNYGPKRLYDNLIKKYSTIKYSISSFQSMIKWIEKHGNPRNNKDWLDFHNSYNLL